jgi:flagellar motor switch/type III secretory pathway protein FliN
VIEVHRFGPAIVTASGVAFRRSEFQSVAHLAAETVRAVAADIAQRMRTLFGVALDALLVGPIVPTASARDVLFDNAYVMRASGTRADVFAVVRATDARSLIALAFGESQANQTSQIERRVLDRVFAQVLPLCAPFCGEVGAIRRDHAQTIAQDCHSYFEVRLAMKHQVALGFAFCGEPPPRPRGQGLRLDDLRTLSVELRARVAAGQLTAASIASMSLGAIIPLQGRLDAVHLLAGRVKIAEGTCGESDGRAALLVAQVWSGAA